MMKTVITTTPDIKKIQHPIHMLKLLEKVPCISGKNFSINYLQNINLDKTP